MARKRKNQSGKSDRLSEAREELEALKDELDKEEEGDSIFLTIKDGDRVLCRLVIDEGNEATFFQKIYTHFFRIGQNTFIGAEQCPGKEDCEVCDEYKANKTRKHWKGIKRKTQYVAAVWLPDQEELKIWKFSKKVMKSLLGIMTDKDYDWITDPDEGRNFLVERIGDDKNTVYDIRVRVKSTSIDLEEILEDAGYETVEEFLEDAIGECDEDHLSELFEDWQEKIKDSGSNRKDKPEDRSRRRRRK